MATCLYVSRYFYPFLGGAERSARVLLKSLVERGFSCHAICFAAREGSIDVDGIVTRLTPDPLQRMREVVATDRPEVVLTQLDFAKEAVDWASQLGIPTILRVPSWEHFCNAPCTFATCGWKCVSNVQCGYRAHCPDLFSKATVVMAISEFVATAVKEFYRRESVVIRPPVERDQYEVGVRTERYITMVRGHTVKGAEFFIDLAKRLPDKRFLLCGICDPHILAAIKQVPNINWCWQKRDMREVYSQTAIYLAPVVWAEPFGRTLVEAMINGIPIIGSDRGAVPEILGPSFVLPLDLDRWCEAIVKYLEDREYYRSASEKLRERSFSFDAEREKLNFATVISDLRRTS